MCIPNPRLWDLIPKSSPSSGNLNLGAVTKRLSLALELDHRGPWHFYDSPKFCLRLLKFWWNSKENWSNSLVYMCGVNDDKRGSECMSSSRSSMGKNRTWKDTREREFFSDLCRNNSIRTYALIAIISCWDEDLENAYRRSICQTPVQVNLKFLCIFYVILLVIILVMKYWPIHTCILM